MTLKRNCVIFDFEHEMEKELASVEMEYEFPDGQIISIGNERFRCPEALFQPALNGLDIFGVHESIYESIMRTDADYKNDLFKNIVLSGGTSMFPGITERMERELKIIAPATIDVKVISLPEKNFLTWLGGAIMASLPSFQHMWISKEEYLDLGPSIVHRKLLR